MKMKWLADTGDVQIPCMNPECLPELDVSLSPTDTPNVYMGSCPDCYTGYKLEIYRADALAPKAEWVVQDSREFYGEEVCSFKSPAGEWGFAYGTMLGGTLAIETLIVGFGTEDEAFTAAETHCRESAQESACEVEA